MSCDFYGTSLHKWILAPIGTGMLYVKKSKIQKVWPLMAAPDSMRENIRKFEQIGTHPASQRNAITEALDLHDAFAKHLWDKHRIWTVAVSTPGEYQGLRTTPNVYTTLEEIDTFTDVMVRIIKRGSIPA